MEVCKYCGEKFPNKGRLLRHYQRCEKKDKKIIPKEWCEFADILRDGSLVRLNVYGIIRGSDIEIIDIKLNR